MRDRDRRVLARIVAAARAGHALTYDDAWGSRAPQRVIGEVLQAFNDDARASRKPLPSVLVVKAKGVAPADGFFEWAARHLGLARDQARAFRRSERQACYKAAADGERWGLTENEIAVATPAKAPPMYPVCRTKGCRSADHLEPEMIGPFAFDTPCTPPPVGFEL